MLNQKDRVKLPEPTLDGSVSLEHCIRGRRSVRSFGNRALRIEEIGQLLWAAQGVTRSDGGRTVPSAGALYPLEVYVLVRKVASLAAGIYRYQVGRHELVLTTSDYDPEALVAAAFGQDWVASAPACICIAAVFKRTTVKIWKSGAALRLPRSRTRRRKPDAASRCAGFGDNNCRSI